MWDDHRRFKQEVLERHPDVEDVLRRGVPTAGWTRATAHPRWAELRVDREVEAEPNAKIRPGEIADRLASLDLSSKEAILGPNYVRE